MSQGYIDPITKKYVKTAGNASIENLPTVTDKERNAGIPVWLTLM